MPMAKNINTPSFQKTLRYSRYIFIYTVHCGFCSWVVQHWRNIFQKNGVVGLCLWVYLSQNVFFFKLLSQSLGTQKYLKLWKYPKISYTGTPKISQKSTIMFCGTFTLMRKTLGKFSGKRYFVNDDPPYWPWLQLTLGCQCQAPAGCSQLTRLSVWQGRDSHR